MTATLVGERGVAGAPASLACAIALRTAVGNTLATAPHAADRICAPFPPAAALKAMSSSHASGSRSLLWLAVSAGLWLSPACVGAGTQTAGAEGKALVAAGAVLLDVRTAAEFASGHVEGAKNIPVHELEARMAELGPASTPVVVYCRSGARSARAAAMLKARGFSTVKDIGPMSAWPRSDDPRP
jgi:rhodanese-related sulfurtransferase